MRIKGTSKADVLRGSSVGDTIDGGRGNDWIEGGLGDDTLFGGAGADTFVLRRGHGNDVVTDFNPASGDRVLFDFGSWSDILYFGRLQDGVEFDNFTGTAHFIVSAVDHDGDGVTDTRITVDEDSITLIGCAPDQLMGWSLMGG